MFFKELRSLTKRSDSARKTKDKRKMFTSGVKRSKAEAVVKRKRDS